GRPQRGPCEPRRPAARPDGNRISHPGRPDAQQRAARDLRAARGGSLGRDDRAGVELARGAYFENPAEIGAGWGLEVDPHGTWTRLQIQSGPGSTGMKFRSVLLGGLLAGTLFIAGSGAASANGAWCTAGPPIQHVTPGGCYVKTHSMVCLPPRA